MKDLKWLFIETKRSKFNRKMFVMAITSAIAIYLLALYLAIYHPV